LGFRLSVISGVTSTIVASILTWLFEFWPIVWSFLHESVVWIWEISTYTIPVPVSLIIGLVLYLSYSTYSLNSKSTEVDVLLVDKADDQLQSIQLQLSEIELKLLRVLAAADGKWLRIEHVSSRIEASHLLTEQILEKLLSKELIFESLNYISGSTYRLSSLGRDYAIEQGLVK
jgi:hypothetical protein